MRKVRPAVGERRHRADGLNLIVLALETDDAKCRAHARDFRDEKFSHGTTTGFFLRAFPGFARGEIKWRISTSWPSLRQRAARRSATRRRWHFSGPASEHSSATLNGQLAVSSVSGTPRAFIRRSTRV